MPFIASFEKTYETDKVDCTINNRKFQFFTPKYIEPYIDQDNPMKDFPLWAKLWESSFVLAQHMACQPVDPNTRILEIGSGLGIIGISAASFGHKITLSDYVDHALAFARANAELNHLPELPVIRLDWHQIDLSRTYDCIIGSEVVYKEDDFSPLKKVFETLLKPGGEVILASEIRQTTLKFFETIQEEYKIQIQKKKLRTESQQTRIIVSRIRRRAF
jgi:2-polyprenyl-3-methyl-5-hydroxy-6-metoxy-1,4-benzoquinol methylase